MKKTVNYVHYLGLDYGSSCFGFFQHHICQSKFQLQYTKRESQVSVLSNGYVLINDTIAISGQTDSFLLGFPHAFGPSVIKAMAYSTKDTSNMFPVELNVPLEDRVGFYGVKVDFPSVTPQVFSVVFVLSSNLLQNAGNFTLVFPAFPSLTETAAVCNCSVVVPDAQYINGTISSLTYNVRI